MIDKEIQNYISMKEILINSEELHLITGLPIDECREIFKSNYLPSRTSFDVLMKYKPTLDLHNKYKHFKTNWFKYTDNKKWVLNKPFEGDEFKIGRKIKFLLEHLCECHTNAIQENWEKKKAMLKNQTSLA